MGSFAESTGWQRSNYGGQKCLPDVTGKGTHLGGGLLRALGGRPHERPSFWGTLEVGVLHSQPTGSGIGLHDVAPDSLKHAWLCPRTCNAMLSGRCTGTPDRASRKGRMVLSWSGVKLIDRLYVRFLMEAYVKQSVRRSRANALAMPLPCPGVVV